MSERHDRTEEICPNCLDPIPTGAERCPSCGVSLNEAPDAVDAEPAEVTSLTPATEGFSAESADTAGESAKDGAKKPTMMQNLVRGMGVYLIYSALTNGYRVLSNPEALGLERGSREHTLGIISNVVYLAAGLLAVWPWIQETLAKRNAAASETTIDAAPVETVEAETGTSYDEPMGGKEIAERNASLSEAADADEFAELRAKADDALRDASEDAE